MKETTTRETIISINEYEFTVEAVKVHGYPEILNVTSNFDLSWLPEHLDGPERKGLVDMIINGLVLNFEFMKTIQDLTEVINRDFGTKVNGPPMDRSLEGARQEAGLGTDLFGDKPPAEVEPIEKKDVPALTVAGKPRKTDRKYKNKRCKLCKRMFTPTGPAQVKCLWN